MIFWIIQWSILSLLFIFLLHHLYSFFIDTLTIPKVKDLVNKPQDRYNELFTLLETKNNTTQNSNKNTDNNNMHGELLDFLNNIKKNNNTPDINMSYTGVPDTNQSNENTFYSLYNT